MVRFSRPALNVPDKNRKAPRCREDLLVRVTNLEAMTGDLGDNLVCKSFRQGAKRLGGKLLCKHFDKKRRFAHFFTIGKPSRSRDS